MPDPRPTYWQVVPCPVCGRRWWAVPWEPQTPTCCGTEMVVVAVYLPGNPQGSEFGRGEPPPAPGVKGA